MNQSQREHIATVMASLSNKAHLLAPRLHEQTIRDSWQRCVEHHGLDPSRMQEARILPWHELREHRQEMEEFRHIAHHGLTVLYQQIAAAGYVVLLTDARGITVDYLGTPMRKSACVVPGCSSGRSGQKPAQAPAPWAPRWPPAKR
ncbi:Acetoin catabolism regulatory protein [Serratia plymuthica]|uniref:Acetoin catabolism regulatory protein n=1 Tax=Serratia plymuthica TaxID=82996 RepID=A0A2X4UW15_SERPL|nr:Acetoin catabolism regulatory protein [Serratia plymuthica]